MRFRSAIAVLAAGSALWLLAAVAVPRADESPLLVAMQDELKRSMSELKLQNEPRPYYMAYEVDEMIDTSLTGRLGAIVADTSRRVRVLEVDVRVGDYAFDSSRFVTGRGGPPAAGNVTAPLDDNYDVMRRQIWLATDTAYKRAVTVYARKKAAFQDRSATDLLPDFSRETPVETVVTAPAGPPPADWADRVKQISSVFRSSAELQNSDVSVGETRGTRYYVNSEGFKVVAPIHAASLRVSADTQAADGTAIRDAFGLVEGRLQDLPPAVDITAQARELAARLTAERTAPIGEEYTGPVLVEGQASGELLAQTLVPLMLARRPPDVETNGRGGGPPNNQQVTPFLTRIGLRVLPDAFSASDTPSLTAYAGKPVPGAYTVDDEGVPAKDVTLVENGKLVTLLTSRTPQRKLLQSNGHSRSGTVQAGVFQMQSSQAVPAAQLKQKYLAVLKDQDKTFGYIVRGIGGQGASPAIQHVVRVSLDGAETFVRGLRFAPIASTTFRNILDASVERPMYSYVSGTGDVVTVIVPSLIFEELEIQQTKDVAQKPPIVPSPITN